MDDGRRRHDGGGQRRLRQRYGSDGRLAAPDRVGNDKRANDDADGPHPERHVRADPVRAAVGCPADDG
ncbi:hypothetical protein ABZU25_26275 [Micromonospora sp. NPDC005215]|uniref:hypothetical protein n=1 Tax=Micromonospora sp. NPDC005215 TaxID=3157024 RepID=UPI0033B755D0